jgi:Uma2 family endonuclease
MRTLFVDPPQEVEDLIAQRKALGQDLYDEVWEGEYHVAAAPTDGHADVQVQLIRILGPLADRAGLLVRGPSNIGGPDDFRVPDIAFFRGDKGVTWHMSAAVVVEVVSPGDESRRKFRHYFRIDVEEFLIVDPKPRSVEWYTRGADGFVPADGSAILGLTSAELDAALDWPG